MSDYYTPDPIWLDFKIENREDYVDKYVIKGNFHSSVHEDIIKSFKTVEYLMAHAYYHWELYDQVLVKLLSIFEMSVKLRSKELNNPLQFQTRNGRTRDKKLVQLIDELKNFGYPANLIRDLQWLRKLRNIESHPDGHHFAGAMKKRAVIPGLNMINRLFIDPIVLTYQNESNEQLLKSKNTFTDDVFIHSFKGKNVLVHDLEFLANIELKGNTCEYWKANPILTDTYASFSEMKFSSPFIFFLTDVQIENGNLIATDFQTKKPVILQRTKVDVNLQAYQLHIDAIEKLEHTPKFGLESSHRNYLNTHLEEFTYINCWTN
ncbi:MAG: hypothetical protein K0S23_1499 [Fluviicola sp.]|jgi:hypothetical protein|uniref:hypothetical protein n=1 Tax=Fluviicola sp. TaxID=1917219 RepID=UPI0026165C70|nr:hypothetical protein [Fluviicola sp.]MDF3027192.1 hypothetical protein [Fluviicola sp.]